jgi:hypothetical protein
MLLYVSYINILSTGYEQGSSRVLLRRRICAGLRHFNKNLLFVQKNGFFDLKVPLFVEKRKNKFVHTLKKNKFVLIIRLFNP